MTFTIATKHMKKVFAALILLTFCTIHTTWAGDVIIIGSDGQARYEDETKNIPVTKETIENTKKKNILNEVTITDETGKKESIYIDNKGNVKNVEEEQITENVQPVDKDKEAEHQKYISGAPKFLELSKSGYEYYSKIKDRANKKEKGYTKMNLLDGDYAIWLTTFDGIAEYHKNGELMGVIKVDKKVLNENKANVVFYEYRLGYNSDSGMGLKHVLFLDFEKDKYISQYIYKHDGKLLCRQTNNDIFVASEARNMIPDWSKKTVFTRNTLPRRIIKYAMIPFTTTWQLGAAAVFIPALFLAVGLDEPDLLTYGMGIFMFPAIWNYTYTDD